jgi:hypothetical protein
MVVKNIGWKEIDWVKRLYIDEAYELWGDAKERGFPDGVPPAVVDALDLLMDFANEHSVSDETLRIDDTRTPMEIIVHELDIDHEWCLDSCEKAGVPW